MQITDEGSRDLAGFCYVPMMPIFKEEEKKDPMQCTDGQVRFSAISHVHLDTSYLPSSTLSFHLVTHAF